MDQIEEQKPFGSPEEPRLATDPPEQPSHPNTVFFGRFGLRAGYGILVFVIAVRMLMIVAGYTGLAAAGRLQEVLSAHAYAQAHPEAHRPMHIDFVPSLSIGEDGTLFLGLLGLCWLLSKSEQRPLRCYGLGRNRIWDLFPGAFWGLAMMGLLVFALHTGGWLVFDGVNLHGLAIVRYGLQWLFAFLLVGFSEEYLFRGYLQFTLMRGLWGFAETLSPAATRQVAFWLTAVILSLLFTFAHIGNGGETPLGLAQVFLAGLSFSYALWRTGSLWWSIGFHMMWDWAQSFLFGVADSGNVSVGRFLLTHPNGKPLLSGGTTGPEGSVFCTLAFLITVLAIRLTTRPGPQPSLEQQSGPLEPASTSGFHNRIA